MESFFYVMLPGIAAMIVALAILLFVVIYAIPKGVNLYRQNKELSDHQAMRKELNQARLILITISRLAEDDTALEVQLGPRCLNEVNSFLNNQKQLER